MMSVRESLIAAILTRLQGLTVPGLPGVVTVHRGRRKDMAGEKLPAILLDCKPMAANQRSAVHVVNVERLSIEGQVKAGSDEALDKALVSIGAAIQCLVETDPTWGGIAVDTTLSEADQAAADGPGIGPLGGVLAVYQVEYWTRPGDPYTPAP